jgi:hypothetical protein
MPRGHCIDYWHKWKRDGNFCGLRKQDADMNDTYLSIVEKISVAGTGLESDFVFDHFTAGAARPLIRCKDKDASTKALNYVVACLKNNEDVTGGDLQATIEGFMGKVKKESTQMRTPESVKESEDNKDNEPILSLAQQNQRRADKAAEGITGIKAVYPITDTTGKVSPDSDMCPGGETCPDCPQPCSIEPCGIKSNHINPGAICTVNPVIINDTHRESPFKTAAQVMAHDKDPLDVAGMFKDMENNETVIKDTLTTQDPAKILREKRIQLAEDLLSCYSERFQMAARDHIRKETTWKNGAADFFYFGGEMLMDPPKTKPSSAGSAMRRA